MKNSFISIFDPQRIFLFFIVIFFVFFGSVILLKVTVDTVDAENGVVVIDSLGKGLKIIGDWEFWYRADGRLVNCGFIKVPGSWKGTTCNDRKLPGIGLGEYRLKLKFKKEDDIYLGLRLNRVESEYQLFINGYELQGNGVVGNNSEYSEPERRARFYSFTRKKGEDVQIKLRVSNFDHPQGGLKQTILIGTTKDINNSFIKSPVFESFVIGILFSNLFSLFFLPYLKGKRLWAIFNLGSFFITAIIYILCSGENIILAIIPMSWASYQHLLYLFVAAPFIHFFFYLRSLYFDCFHRGIYYLIQSSFFVFIGIVLIFSPSIFIEWLPLFHVTCSICFLYWLWGLTKAVLLKKEFAKTNLFGISVYFCLAITEMIHLHEYSVTIGLVPLGFIFWGFSNLFVFFSMAKAQFIAAELATQQADFEARQRELVEKEKQVEAERVEAVVKIAEAEAQRAQLEKEKRKSAEEQAAFEAQQREFVEREKKILAEEKKIEADRAQAAEEIAAAEAIRARTAEQEKQQAEDEALRLEQYKKEPELALLGRIINQVAYIKSPDDKHSTLTAILYNGNKKAIREFESVRLRPISENREFPYLRACSNSHVVDIRRIITTTVKRNHSYLLLATDSGDPAVIDVSDRYSKEMYEYARINNKETKPEALRLLCEHSLKTQQTADEKRERDRIRRAQKTKEKRESQC